MRQLGASSASHPPAFQVTVEACSASTLTAAQSSRGVNIALLHGLASPVEEQCSGAGPVTDGSCPVSRPFYKSPISIAVASAIAG